MIDCKLDCKRLPALLLLGAAFTAFAANPAKPVKSIDFAQAKSGSFSVMLAFSSDPPAYFKAIEAGPQAMVALSADAVRRGGVVNTTLVFTGCKPDANQQCNVSVQYKLVTSNGKVTRLPDAAVWSKAAPQGSAITPAESQMRIAIEPTDPLGVYEVQASVRDLNANTALAVKAGFTVMP